MLLCLCYLPRVPGQSGREEVRGQLVHPRDVSDPGHGGMLVPAAFVVPVWLGRLCALDAADACRNILRNCGVQPLSGDLLLPGDVIPQVHGLCLCREWRLSCRVCLRIPAVWPGDVQQSGYQGLSSRLGVVYPGLLFCGSCPDSICSVQVRTLPAQQVVVYRVETACYFRYWSARA